LFFAESDVPLGVSRGHLSASSTHGNARLTFTIEAVVKARVKGWFQIAILRKTERR
jgi:hypothetical protein